MCALTDDDHRSTPVPPTRDDYRSTAAPPTGDDHDNVSSGRHHSHSIPGVRSGGGASESCKNRTIGATTVERLEKMSDILIPERVSVH